MAWSEHDVETLKRMWSEGATASVIAEALGGGKSRNAVVGKADRMGLPGRANPVDFDAMFERVADRVIDAPRFSPVSIERAAAAEGMNPALAQRMWNERIVATHGGDPR
jgi:GcrA cell cycle regulator